MWNVAPILTINLCEHQSFHLKLLQYSTWAEPNTISAPLKSSRLFMSRSKNLPKTAQKSIPIHQRSKGHACFAIYHKQKTYSSCKLCGHLKVIYLCKKTKRGENIFEWTFPLKIWQTKKLTIKWWIFFMNFRFEHVIHCKVFEDMNASIIHDEINDELEKTRLAGQRWCIIFGKKFS